jgi:hypothetical protein
MTAHSRLAPRQHGQHGQHGQRRPASRGLALAAAVLAGTLTACGAGGTGGSGGSGGSGSAPPAAAAGSTPAASLPLGGRFLDPRAGATVTRQQTVSGVVTGLPAGDAAWLVVYTVAAPAYWPQQGPLRLDSAGAFKATAVFGSDAAANVGQHFVVRLVITSARATGRFRAFLADASHGLSRLPGGVRTLARVTVTRR